MASYSFDVVSDFDRQELVNTLDQVRRDVGNRYDLKDSGTEIDLAETEVVITTASDMTLQAVEDILRTKATKRDLSLKIFDLAFVSNACKVHLENISVCHMYIKDKMIKRNKKRTTPDGLPPHTSPTTCSHRKRHNRF